MSALRLRAATTSLAASILSIVSCGHNDCVPVPGPVRFAVVITVTAEGSAGPVAGASVVVFRPSQPQLGHWTQTCNPESGASVCRVQGEPGTYNLEVGAPGFRTQQFTVIVQSTIDKCGYTDFTTERLSVALQPDIGHGQSRVSKPPNNVMQLTKGGWMRMEASSSARSS